MKLRAQQIAEEKTRAEAAAIEEQRSPIAGASAQDGDYDDDEEIGGGQFDGANSLSAQLLAARDAWTDLKAKFVKMQAERDAYKSIVDSMQADVNEQVRLSQARLSQGSKPARGSKQPDRGDQGDAEADLVDDEDDEATEMTKWQRILAGQDKHLGNDCLRQYTSERLPGNSVSLYFNADADPPDWVKAILMFTRFNYVTIYDERCLTILGKEILGNPSGPHFLAGWGTRYRAPSDSETLRAATLLKGPSRGKRTMKYATRTQAGFKRPPDVIPAETSSDESGDEHDESDEERKRQAAISHEESHGPEISAIPAKKLRPPPRCRVRT